MEKDESDPSAAKKKTKLSPFLKKSENSLSHIELNKVDQNGFVDVINIDGVNITMVSGNFSNLPFKNMWQIMNYAKPDLIMLGVRPDNYFKGFQIDNGKKIDDGENGTGWDVHSYVDQLVRPGNNYFLELFY